MNHYVTSVFVPGRGSHEPEGMKYVQNVYFPYSTEGLLVQVYDLLSGFETEGVLLTVLGSTVSLEIVQQEDPRSYKIVMVG